MQEACNLFSILLLASIWRIRNSPKKCEARRFFPSGLLFASIHPYSSMTRCSVGVHAFFFFCL